MVETGAMEENKYIFRRGIKLDTATLAKHLVHINRQAVLSGGDMDGENPSSSPTSGTNPRDRRQTGKQ